MTFEKSPNPSLHSGELTIELGSKSLLEAFEAFFNKIFIDVKM